MEAMSTPYCPSCGAPAMPSSQLCTNCGAPLTPAPPSYPYYPPVVPPKDHTALIVVVVVLVVVIVVALPVALYVLVSGLIAPPGMSQPPVAIGVAVAKSADGLNWVLTLVSVPSGLSQNATTVTLFSGSGATLLPATTMFQLETSARNGVWYVPTNMGAMFTTCAAGDRILAAAGSGTNQYPSGTQYEIMNSNRILSAGTFQ